MKSPTAADALRRWAVACAELAAARRELRAVDPAGLSDEELLDLLDDLEVEARRQAAVGLGLVAELDARGLALEWGYASTAVLLSERLRIGRREAAGRVALAAAVGPRRAVTGERLEPVPAGRRRAGRGDDLGPARHGHRPHRGPVAGPGGG